MANFIFCVSPGTQRCPATHIWDSISFQDDVPIEINQIWVEHTTGSQVGGPRLMSWRPQEKTVNAPSAGLMRYCVRVPGCSSHVQATPCVTAVDPRTLTGMTVPIITMGLRTRIPGVPWILLWGVRRRKLGKWAEIPWPGWWWGKPRDFWSWVNCQTQWPPFSSASNEFPYSLYA
jgi:hypothetical protein